METVNKQVLFSWKSSVDVNNQKRTLPSSASVDTTAMTFTVNQETTWETELIKGFPEVERKDYGDFGPHVDAAVSKKR